MICNRWRRHACSFQLNSRERWYWVFQWLEWPCMPSFLIWIRPDAWSMSIRMYYGLSSVVLYIYIHLGHPSYSTVYLVSFCTYTWAIPRTPWCGIATHSAHVARPSRDDYWSEGKTHSVYMINHVNFIHAWTNFLANYTAQCKHSQCTYIHLYECTHANPLL